MNGFQQNKNAKKKQARPNIANDQLGENNSEVQPSSNSNNAGGTNRRRK